MALVTSGKMNKHIAADLCLSEVTVKLHRGAAMRKMNARTLVDLTRMAEQLLSQTGHALAPRTSARERYFETFMPDTPGHPTFADSPSRRYIP